MLELTAITRSAACGSYQALYAKSNDTTFISIGRLVWLEIQFFENVWPEFKIFGIEWVKCWI